MNLNPTFKGRRWFLLCYPDQLDADGFSDADIEDLFNWQDGALLVTDPHRLHRLKYLATLIVREEEN